MNAKVHFAHGRWRDAKEGLARILAGHPHSFAAPEALYLGAVCDYRLTQNPAVLKEVAYQEMQQRYPASEWALRTQPYRLL